LKREVRLLHRKSLDSLVLAVEHFNRPSDTGRVEAVLILLDHAFELLLKAAILHRGGRIREPRAQETIGFDKCVRKCLSESAVRFLDTEQALTLQIINSLRDAAQHYLLELSEQQIYLYSQAGITLYADLQRKVFQTALSDLMPSRVLPVTTSPPQTFAALMESEFNEVKALLKPRSRKHVHARAKLRALAIIEASLGGVRTQPTEGDLNRLTRGIRRGTTWQDLFPGVAQLRLDTRGTGLSVCIRLMKADGEPVHIVPEGTPGATVVAIQKVDMIGFYSLNLTNLAEKCDVSRNKLLALIKHLGLQEDQEFFKVIAIGRSVFKRYSPKALDALKKALKTVDIDEIWRQQSGRKHAA
jgi:hypothetical protein